MSGYAIYRYFGARPSKWQKGGWHNFLRARLSAVAPTPGLPVKPTGCDLLHIPVGPATFLWHAALMGYGLPAHYASAYLLKGKAMSSADEIELRRWALARAELIEAAYEITIYGSSTLIVRRPIYELLESSERGLVSYLLGNAFAEVCVPAIRDGNEYVTGPLYHSSLLEQAAKIGVEIEYYGGNRIDLVAFGVTRSASFSLGLHLVECKGVENIYESWIKAIRQCMSVKRCRLKGGIWTRPASMTTSTTFHGGNVVRNSLGPVGPGSRCALTRITHRSSWWADLWDRLMHNGPLSASDASPGRSQDAYAVVGLRLLATALVVRAANRVNRGDTLTFFRLSHSERSEGPQLEAAIPTRILDAANDFLGSVGEGIQERSARVQALSELAVHALELPRIDAPAAYRWSPSDSWLAFRESSPEEP